MIFKKFSNKKQLIWILNAKVMAKTKLVCWKIQIKLFSVTVHRKIFQNVFEHKFFMVGRARHPKNSKIGFTSFGVKMKFL